MSINHSYATVIFPLAVPKPYTYKVPEEMQGSIKKGIRVEVPLRNKLYAALVVELHGDIDLDYRPRYVNAIIDEVPIISDVQYKFWKWLSTYYCASLGEVMNVALPSGLKLSSETKIILDQRVEEDFQGLEDDEFMISEALSIQNELTIGEIQDILNKKTVYPIIRALLERGTIYVKEELIEKYKAKTETYLRTTSYYREDSNRLTEALDLCKRSELQTKAILAYTQLSKETEWVARADLYDLAGINKSVVDALVKKEIIEVEKKEISRLTQEDEGGGDIHPLSLLQSESLTEIKKLWEIHDAVLLHGVTGSGKTRVYIELIMEALENEKQVLYLLPEIALTAQIVHRLKAVFGSLVQVYHSRMSNHERVEMWRAVKAGQSIVIGARSSLFLPYNDLGVIIIDEEHDPSYKQQDPAPRYNARDAAVFLAMSYGAKVLLGSATPSLESFFNARQGKYGMVEMMERYGNVSMPDIQVVNLTAERKAKRLVSYFSKQLRDDIDHALVNGKQALLFQNRRGYAPTIQCLVCGFTAGCPNCDITLTYHKYYNELRCHLCAFRTPNPSECPACGNNDFRQIGFGTEKIEDVIKELFPTAKVGRLDYDTARSKAAYEKLILDFQNNEIDILVGTQMVTKGLDFDNIQVVGVLNADLLLFFPDFRASERAFQLLTQVAGRAGRRKEQGKVVIQTSKPSHPVIMDTIEYNYHKFIAREAHERKQFQYPPYYRMINILLKHKKPVVVHKAAELYAEFLRKRLGKRILGPAEPGVAKVRGLYLRFITVKLEKDHKLIAKTKNLILEGRSWVKDHDGLKSVRVNIDVDPY